MKTAIIVILVVWAVVTLGNGWLAFRAWRKAQKEKAMPDWYTRLMKGYRR